MRRSTEVASAARRVPGQRVPGRRRHRLRYRRPTALAGRHRAPAVRERGGYRRGLFAIILMFGPVSGGHFNPVVSFVDAAFGGLSWRDALAYLPAQVAGCIGGAVVANVMFAEPVVSISTKHRASGPHFLSEIVATVGLLLVIFALARSGRSRTAPAAVGAYIGAAYFFTSSTSFANPAITVGRMFSNTFAGIAPSSVPSVHRRAGRRRRRGSARHQGPLPRRHPRRGLRHRLPSPQATPANGARRPLPSPASGETA